VNDFCQAWITYGNPDPVSTHVHSAQDTLDCPLTNPDSMPTGKILNYNPVSGTTLKVMSN